MGKRSLNPGSLVALLLARYNEFFDGFSLGSLKFVLGYNFAYGFSQAFSPMAIWRVFPFQICIVIWKTCCILNFIYVFLVFWLFFFIGYFILPIKVLSLLLFDKSLFSIPRGRKEKKKKLKQFKQAFKVCEFGMLYLVACIRFGKLASYLHH